MHEIVNHYFWKFLKKYLQNNKNCFNIFLELSRWIILHKTNTVIAGLLLGTGRICEGSGSLVPFLKGFDVTLAPMFVPGVRTIEFCSHSVQILACNRNWINFFTKLIKKTCLYHSFSSFHLFVQPLDLGLWLPRHCQSLLIAGNSVYITSCLPSKFIQVVGGVITFLLWGKIAIFWAQ